MVSGGATRDDVHPNRLFPRYLMKNFKSWIAFAEDRHGLEISSEQIMLVRGRVKAAEWAVAAFVEGGLSHKIVFQASAGSYASASFELSRTSYGSGSPEWRSGPKRSTVAADAKDQCVFLSTYRLKQRRRRLFSFKVEAAAEPTDPDAPPPTAGADPLEAAIHHINDSNESLCDVIEAPPILTVSSISSKT